VSKTVLVVDDQDAVRDVVRIALEAAGYRVLEAGTPSLAIEVAREGRPVDLLLVDVVMPEMDAFELAERLRHEVPDAHVLYTSGYTNAREEGAFIPKPFTPAQLVAKVEEILAAE